MFRVDADRALTLLARAPIVHLATTTPAGAPVLRALDAAVLGDAIYFHGARVGEKATCLGRPAVVSAEEVVARVRAGSWTRCTPVAPSRSIEAYRCTGRSPRWRTSSSRRVRSTR